MCLLTEPEKFAHNSEKDSMSRGNWNRKGYININSEQSTYVNVQPLFYIQQKSKNQRMFIIVLAVSRNHLFDLQTQLIRLFDIFFQTTYYFNKKVNEKEICLPMQTTNMATSISLIFMSKTTIEFVADVNHPTKQKSIYS